MSDVLVIHPDDRSTDFLKLIYEGKGYDVINDCDETRGKLYKEISRHKKIIMMGHGVGSGLINPKYRNIWIDDSFAELLREKETISIWCWSDVYFRRNNIPGFHTGVILSEVSEQMLLLGKVYLNKEDQLENMEFMARLFNNCIDKNPNEIRSYMIKNYNRKDPVSEFNRKNMIVL